MKFLKIILISFLLTSCIGSLNTSIFGVGVNINLDPRSPGLYLDDKLAETLIMKKIVTNDYKQIFLNVKVIDGTAILSGRVEKAEDKLKMTKFAWETAGIKAVRNDIIVADSGSFHQRAKDILKMQLGGHRNGSLVDQDAVGDVRMLLQSLSLDAPPPPPVPPVDEIGIPAYRPAVDDTVSTVPLELAVNELATGSG